MRIAPLIPVPRIRGNGPVTEESLVQEAVAQALGLPDRSSVAVIEARFGHATLPFGKGRFTAVVHVANGRTYDVSGLFASEDLESPSHIIQAALTPHRQGIGSSPTLALANAQ